jgi:hypothetical protein
MLGVLVARVLYYEVINNQTEDGGTGSMGEETGSVLCLYVIVSGEMLEHVRGGLGARACIAL